MPFTREQIKARRAALAAQEAEVTRQREAQEAREREQRELRAALSVAFPDIPIEDAVNLWEVAVRLTDGLISQFMRGESALEATTDTWRTLFFTSHVSFGYGGAHMTVEDKTYLPTLDRMGRLYNDIGQTFSLQNMHAGEWSKHYAEPRIKIAASAPLPS